MKKLSLDEIKRLNKADLLAHTTDMFARLTDLEAASELPTDVKELHVKIMEQDKLIGELSDEIAKKPTGSTAPDVVSVDGKDYRVAIPKFKHLGVEKTIADLKTDKELCKALIARGSGVLKAL